MMTKILDAELATVLERLIREHDVLPFLEKQLATNDARLAPLPPEMLEELTSSPDFESVRPGEPVWIMMSAPPDAAAEIIIYRAEANGRYYVVAPIKT